MLMSVPEKSKNKIKCQLVQTKQQVLLGESKLELEESLHKNHKLDLVLAEGNAAYFVAQSKFDIGNKQAVNDLEKVLLVQAIPADNSVTMKKLWVPVPSWECRVLALRSAISPTSLYFYVFGWNRSEI